MMQMRGQFLNAFGLKDDEPRGQFQGLPCLCARLEVTVEIRTREGDDQGMLRVSAAKLINGRKTSPRMQRHHGVAWLVLIRLGQRHLMPQTP